MMSNPGIKPLLLWFDLTRDRSTEALMAQFSHVCECKLAKTVAHAERHQADMICMHFDRPDTLNLNLLLEVKRNSPAIPITMFTVQHSEELAVWAMRSRVWEYLVLPLTTSEMSRYLEVLKQLCEVRRTVKSQTNAQQIDHLPSLPDSIRLTGEHHKHKALSTVMPYLDQHFRECIDQKALAQRCGMTTARFSRLFKEINGLGFLDYILSKRMNLAMDLLLNSQMPITSIGYEAGFKDPSYFARAFKQFTNCTPSEYRQARQPGGAVREAEPLEDANASAVAGVLTSTAFHKNR
ncbi:DNA-binding response regulator [Pseudomonas sp. AFG_SD02_1510_Pfu_092]|uniref:response regulator transcription factor n=1 Tax=Pseudomonas sp. AFG_SD02_1510_Pfu_092 TaxID=2259497 RepID=UPI000DEFF7F2|nr:DNA-binding response regulator [Pseudomonas sp. AFG_SD02_1510_Pfu_092]RCL24832.1 DNA-binding response regulator [Pseudomonas sp. AFG_SD02_1510_Pfu_092]